MLFGGARWGLRLTSISTRQPCIPATPTLRELTSILWPSLSVIGASNKLPYTDMSEYLTFDRAISREQSNKWSKNFRAALAQPKSQPKAFQDPLIAGPTLQDMIEANTYHIPLLHKFNQPKIFPIQAGDDKLGKVAKNPDQI